MKHYKCLSSAKIHPNVKVVVEKLYLFDVGEKWSCPPKVWLPYSPVRYPSCWTSARFPNCRTKLLYYCWYCTQSWNRSRCCTVRKFGIIIWNLVSTWSRSTSLLNVSDRQNKNLAVSLKSAKSLCHHIRYAEVKIGMFKCVWPLKVFGVL